uniref:Polypyrimidine tract-binding protein homolog 3 n=1 Tax=Tanacetum cinerariifolium TaxID=118510 RepID=A0A6L2LLL9_TANCI|nr:polypyrimidine tract-binding protein homolog 3 [Tanacetum cinerariifolium]
MSCTSERAEVYYECKEPFKSLKCLWVRSKSIAVIWLEKVVTPLIDPAIKGFEAAPAVLKPERLNVDKHGKCCCLCWGAMVEVIGIGVVMEMGEKMAEKGVGKNGEKQCRCYSILNREGDRGVLLGKLHNWSLGLTRTNYGAQGDHEAEVFQVSNDDTAVAKRRLEDKQLKEKTNTKCLVRIDGETRYNVVEFKALIEGSNRALIEARIAEACFEDERSNIAIAKPNELTANIHDQDLEQTTRGRGDEPNRILLVTNHYMVYPITIEVLKEIFSLYGIRDGGYGYIKERSCTASGMMAPSPAKSDVVMWVDCDNNGQEDEKEMHSGYKGPEGRTEASMVVGLGSIADPTHRLSKLTWNTLCISGPGGDSTRYATAPTLSRIQYGPKNRGLSLLDTCVSPNK